MDRRGFFLLRPSEENVDNSGSIRISNESHRRSAPPIVRIDNERSMKIKHEGHVILKVQGADDYDVIYSLKRDYPLHHLQLDYCNKLGHEYGTVRFVYRGVKIPGDKTPNDLGMKNGCVIDALVDQTGG